LQAELEKKDVEIKRLGRELDQVRMKSASSSVASAGEKIKEVRGVKVLAHRVDNLERAQMRTLVDQLRDKIGSGVVVLGSATNGNVALIVGVTKDLTSRIQAGKVIGPVAQKVGGKGGGRPDLAEAGGKDPEALDAALGEVYGVVGVGINFFCTLGGCEDLRSPVGLDCLDSNPDPDKQTFLVFRNLWCGGHAFRIIHGERTYRGCCRRWDRVCVFESLLLAA
jgi:hypothetical protein